jgi:hypothetical protein
LRNNPLPPFSKGELPTHFEKELTFLIKDCCLNTLQTSFSKSLSNVSSNLSSPNGKNRKGGLNRHRVCSGLVLHSSICNCNNTGNLFSSCLYRNFRLKLNRKTCCNYIFPLPPPRVYPSPCLRRKSRFFLQDLDTLVFSSIK